MTVEVGLTLPILEGETPEDAIKRIDETVFTALVQEVGKIVKEGRQIIEG